MRIILVISFFIFTASNALAGSEVVVKTLWGFMSKSAAKSVTKAAPQKVAPKVAVPTEKPIATTGAAPAELTAAQKMANSAAKNGGKASLKYDKYCNKSDQNYNSDACFVDKKAREVTGAKRQMNAK